MENQYRASIIVSIFKAGRFISHLLQDITRQSIFKDCEFLLLDANSPDGELFYIKPYLRHQNIKYINIGKCSLYEAWNKGIEVSASSIIANWNADDRRFKNSLEKQVKFLEENENSDVCYGHTIVSRIENEIAEECRSSEIYQALDGTLENQLLHNSPHCFPVWRKSIHDRFGLFNTSYFSGSDYDMWFRVLKGGGILTKLDIITGLYYRNPNGISSGNESFKKAVKEVVSIREKYK